MIRAQFAEQITSLTNVGSPGTSVTSLAPVINDVLDAEYPDLLMLNYCMNDHYDGPTTTFETNMTTVINATQARGIRVFMTGFFHKNPYWIGYSANAVERFVVAQQNLARAYGISYADVNKLWKRVHKRKSLEEMLGDNFHHPGNYGHKVYFTEMFPHLITEPVSSADVPSYIVMPKGL